MIETLRELVAIPGISAKAFPPEEVRRSARAVADVLMQYGLSNVQLLETRGHPAVYGECGARSREAGSPAPTVLIYGHHDVQPPGDESRWLSPPFQAEVRDGRVYGRGTADDKGGFLAYLEAVRASDELPCNIRMLVEGEEEIGSPNLAALLDEHRDLFACDYIVLCDTPNFDTGVPALTYRLRGNCLVDVEVRCLEQPLHSGQGGGLVPDATMILCRALAAIDVRKLEEGGARVSPPAPPFDETRIRKAFGVLEGVDLIGTWEDVWARPSLTITAFESVPMARAANQIADAARARLSLRTVSPITTDQAANFLCDSIRANIQRGIHVTTTILGGPSWWEADPSHRVFAAARRALARGFGTEAVMIGSGGSIGFVKPFADLIDVPPLLTGVQDPRSRAHSENESLHLGDWEKATKSAMYLFEELAS